MCSECAHSDIKTWLSATHNMLTSFSQIQIKVLLTKRLVWNLNKHKDCFLLPVWSKMAVMILIWNFSKFSCNYLKISVNWYSQYDWPTYIPYLLALIKFLNSQSGRLFGGGTYSGEALIRANTVLWLVNSYNTGSPNRISQEFQLQQTTTRNNENIHVNNNNKQIKIKDKKKYNNVLKKTLRYNA